MRKSFSIHSDFYKEITHLSREQRGDILLALISWANNDEPPSIDPVCSMLVRLMTAQQTRISIANSANGTQGGRGNKSEKSEKSEPENKKPKKPTITKTITNTKKIKGLEYHLSGKPDEEASLSLDDTSSLGECGTETLLAGAVSGELNGNSLSLVTSNEGKVGIYKAIIDHLNTKCGTKFKDTAKITRSAIKSRLDEGFTLDDFFAVIDKKVFEWGNCPKMAKYLRPETLFSNKFDRYLNDPWNDGREQTLNNTQLIALRIIAKEEAKTTENANSGGTALSVFVDSEEDDGYDYY